MATNNPDDDLDNAALVKQLGGDDPARVSTQPVKDTAAPPAVDAAAPPAAAAPADGSAWDPSKATASVFQGFQPKHAMEGFDWNREQNTGKSAKDAFAYLSQNAPPPPIQDKAALGQWFDQHIAPGMNALGHKVTSPAQGDKFGFENWQGKFNVDFGRGAGAEGGALAWQVDDPSAVMSNQAYAPRPENAAANAAGAAAIGGGEQDAQQQLQAELNAIINGGASPIDEQALLEQLQV